MRSLKKMSYLAFIGVSALLVFVIILGVRQYQLTERYSKIITQSEQMIFQFSTIREQITTSLIEKNWGKIVSAADQFTHLNSALARLQENTLIPSEYRLDMAKQVDLSGLAILAKDILSSDDKAAYSLGLQHKMRTLAEYLMQFDRIIVSQIRAEVVQFQTVMIGALGTVICLISFSLLILYKKTMIPLLRLAEQTEDPDVLVNGFSYDNNACAEVALLIDSVNNLLKMNNDILEAEGEKRSHSEQFSTIINESTNLSNGIINYAQLLADTYREVEIGAEETKILQNIIDAAQRISQLNKINQ
ncbi:MAG: hypothetical protein H8E41_05120 [Desulfobulbaceae bacterium]|uniref:Uncharacterized protein n=1 Tax=Candidatus Desulfobia pelagia TaxID=2841692 RepID=A0A8J6NCF0_9BACT|nr:hypothetical protein [Candidatus Desulfobia pelagia]